MLDHKSLKNKLSFSGLSQNSGVQGHILKFMNNRKSHEERGKICFPQQTYGNAQQSPDHHKGTHRIPKRKRYASEHRDRQYLNNSYQKLTQQNEDSANQDKKVTQQKNIIKKLKFHRRKGGISDFIDSNALMIQTTRLMGFERDSWARDFSNKDRQKRIFSLRPKTTYKNEKARIPERSRQYFQNIVDLTSQKMRIRKNRNSQNLKFSSSVQMRNIKSSQLNVTALDRYQMQNKMLQTSRDWSPTKQATKSRAVKVRKTFFDSRKGHEFLGRTQEIQPSKKHQLKQNHEETLQDWYRTTCSSKWVYNKKGQNQGQGQGQEPSMHTISAQF